MKKTRFSLLGWCFFEFELVLIKGIVDNQVVLISDGFKEKSSSNFNNEIFNLDEKYLQINSGFKYWDQQFSDLKYKNFNYKGLHKELVKRWIEVCNVADDEANVSWLMHKLSSFGGQVIVKAKSLEFGVVEGVELIKN